MRHHRQLQACASAQRRRGAHGDRTLAVVMRRLEHEELPRAARMAGDLLPRSEHDDVGRGAPDVDLASDPREGDRVAPPLEAHEAIATDAPGDDTVEEFVHVRQGLQQRTLRRERTIPPVRLGGRR